MNKEIREAIEKNLPAQVAGEMKKFIENAERDAADLEANKHTIKNLESELKALQGLKLEEDSVNRREIELNQREIDLDARERNFALQQAELRIELLTSNMNNMKELVNKVFGHPNVTVSSHKEVPLVSRDGYQNGTAHTYDSETQTEGKQ